MKNRQYKEVQLSKKESELMEFLQTGSNNFLEAYYIYKHRKRKTEHNHLKITSWFNKTLLKLHKKGIAKNIPFIWRGIKWMNPGVEASKANLVIEQKIEHIKEITTQRPIL